MTWMPPLFVIGGFMIVFVFVAVQATSAVAGGFVIDDVDKEECESQGYNDPNSPTAKAFANDVAAKVNTWFPTFLFCQRKLNNYH